ncbi:Sedoheptulose-bisphosphatase/4-nitrophenylphosphatase [Chlorociboria aeruginascens]|nr:Sedoheptulose-bisphosphatase/4-nitrophenylphosphatase [Chlorociboria aeruginascens]
MRRTLQTAQQGLGWLMKRGVPVIVRAEWQENSAKPCDCGSDISVMEKEWPQFDWSEIDPVYPAKTGIYEHSMSGLVQRGIEARKWLKNRPEKVIAVVSHSGFLRVCVSFRKYSNADFRIFEFGEGDGEEGLNLVEWELTEKKGGGLGLSEIGHFGMIASDYPHEPETELGEVVDENPH